MEIKGQKYACQILILCTASLSLVAAEEWIHRTVLDGDDRYHMYWNPPNVKNGDSRITFKIEVQTHGYVGFGLSPNGGMAGSDIVTGWIRDGKIYFQDRHGIGDELPKRDASQDWELLEGSENDTHTILKFSRKLDTCDEEDILIDDSTMRIIYAYSEEDPYTEDVSYHFNHRGTKSAMLLQSKIEQGHYLEDDELLYWDIKSPNFTIPTLRTMYWCKIYKTPPVSKKHHIIYVKPIIEEGHEEFVHHMLLYECVSATSEEYEPFVDFIGHQCHHPNMPEAMKKCEGVSIAWAVGGETDIKCTRISQNANFRKYIDVKFPDHVGLPLDPIPGKYFMLEIHYDNQQLKAGVVDQSGLRIYYTPKVREYDAGCLMVGSTISPREFIPPGRAEYTVTGHSNAECLAPEMAAGGIKVLGVLLHSHLIGKRMIARHFRKNKELAPLAVEKNYDFNYQEYRYYTKAVNVLLGDQITVECTYNSSGRNKTTFGGESTEEEMCLAFVLYYPRMDRYASLSVPTIQKINKALHTNLTMQHLKNGKIYPILLSYDWENANISQIEHTLRFSEHNTHCYLGDGMKNSVKSLISYPSNIELYTEESTCVKSLMLSRSSVNWNLENVCILYIITMCFAIFILK